MDYLVKICRESHSTRFTFSFRQDADDFVEACLRSNGELTIKLYQNFPGEGYALLNTEHKDT